MATSQMSGFIQRLRRVLREGAGLTDGQLLGDYLSRRDEAAIAALVRRHGPMVWGVCRRVLRDHHDAEDAFQTTFLVLVRKAASIASRELLANWLYGVAHQTALKARATAAKRKGRERPMTETQEPAVREEAVWRDLHSLLDEELSRLPAKHRSIIVLCDLEGKTRKQVAEQLGCPEGTVASRLARARIMLAKRLTRRDVALSSGVLAAVLSQEAASAGVPTSVASSTIKAATLFAAGKAAASGAISVKVAALTEGVMKAMLFTKLKAVLAVMLVLGFMATGATILTSRTAAGQNDKKPVAEKPVATSAKTEPEKKEAEFAWGKEVNGLQLGLAFVPADKNVYRPGEEILCEVRVRNVSKAPITISNMIDALEPEITDAKGEKVHVAMPPISLFIVIPTEQILKPGETVALYPRKLAVERVPEGKADPKALISTPTIWVPEGKYKIGLSEFVQSTLKLSTGIVEFEVKDKDAKVSSEKKEGFTAWGKEVGGLQAGLGYRPGQKRAYRHGETATIVLRVRNVGKEAVEFKHIYAFFVENPPTITDADGKIVKLPPGRSLGLEQGAALPLHRPRSTNLSAGDEAEIYKWEFDLQPKGGIGINKEVLAIHGTGKFSVQCEHVVGPTFGNPNHPNPTLDKLATGKLELEIKPEAPAKPGVKAPEKQEEQDKDAKMKPLKIRVYIEKINDETSTITASCMLIGEIDNVTKPLRFENLRVSEKAQITNGGKEVKLTDLQHLPRDTHFYLFLKAYEEEFGFEVVGIETIRK